MAKTLISKRDLGPLSIGDSDVESISISKLDVPTGHEGHVPQVQGGELVFAPLAPGSLFVDNEIPIGVKNSINTEFVLAYLPAPPSSLQLFKGGLLLTQGAGNDYTLDNQTITFLDPPDANDVIVVFYRR